MKHNTSMMKTTNQSSPTTERMTVSLKTLADRLDAHRSSVRRWLREAGIKPVAVGRGRKGAIRYRWVEVRDWLDSLPDVD